MQENIEVLNLTDDTDIPNNPDLPALVYRQIMQGSGEENARHFEAAFARHNWVGIWRNGIFNYHHFHPDAHEVLGIAAGNVQVQLGGKNGQSLKLQQGDMVILPAGTGHKRLSKSDDLLVIGAYPKGQEEYSMCRNKRDCSNADEKIRQVSMPEQDPFFGTSGPLFTYWK